jgi:hypothetical protein
MFISYIMIAVVAVLGSLVAWDDFRPIERKPEESES